MFNAKSLQKLNNMSSLNELKNKDLLIVLFVGIFIAMFSFVVPASSIWFNLILGILIFALSIYSLPSALGIVLISCIVIPDGSGAYQFFGFEMAGFLIRTVEVMLLGLFAGWGVNLLRENYKFKVGAMGWAVIAFLGYIIINFAVALSMGHEFADAVNDIRRILYYLIFFVVLSVVASKKGLKNQIQMIILGASIFSILFISMYLAKDFITSAFGFNFNETAGDLRFNFRNTSILFVFVPLIACLLAFDKISKRTKLFYASALAFVLIAGIVSETRALWLAILISLGGCIGFLIYYKKVKFTKFIIGVILTAVIFTSLYFLFDVSKTGVISNLIDRASTFTDLGEDSSLLFREKVNYQAFQNFKEAPLFGYGAGQMIQITHARRPFDLQYVDNSFLTTAYKFGLVGLAFLLVMYGSFIYKTIKVYLASKKDTFVRGFSIGLLCAFPALVFFSFTSVILIHYQVIIVFASLFAIVQILDARLSDCGHPLQKQVFTIKK